MKYLKLYVDFRQSMKSLSYAERGRLITGMLDYADAGSTDEISGNERFVFDAAMAEIDRQRAAYNNKVKGALKATEHRTISHDIEKIVTMKNDIVVNRNGIVQDKDKDKDDDKDKDKDTTTKSLTGTSNLAVGGGDPDLEDIVRLWDKVSGCRLSAWDAETLSTLLAEHGKEKLTHAINVAAGNGAPRLAYVDAVLRNRGKARNKPKKRSGKFAEIYEKY